MSVFIFSQSVTFPVSNAVAASTVLVTVTSRLGDVTRASVKADDPGNSSLL